jgi:hypothetical protein
LFAEQFAPAIESLLAVQREAVAHKKLLHIVASFRSLASSVRDSDALGDRSASD